MSPENELQREKDQLIEYRITVLERQYAEMKVDIKGMVEVLNRLDKKLSNVPPEGLSCNLHALRMDAFRKELDDHKAIIEDLQSFKWRAVGVLSVVMLLVQLLGSTVFEKFTSKSTLPPVEIKLLLPTNALPSFSHQLDANGYLIPK